jgi:hypothetical protein
MARKPQREEPSNGVEHVDPPYVPNIRRPGDKGSAFREAPLAEPRAERQFLTLLGTNAAVVAMWCFVAVVVVIVLILVVTRV